MPKGLTTMSAREIDRGELIRRVREKRLTQHKAAVLMGLSVRQVKRLCRLFKDDGLRQARGVLQRQVQCFSRQQGRLKRSWRRRHPVRPRARRSPQHRHHLLEAELLSDDTACSLPRRDRGPHPDRISPADWRLPGDHSSRADHVPAVAASANRVADVDAKDARPQGPSPARLLPSQTP